MNQNGSLKYLLIAFFAIVLSVFDHPILWMSAILLIFLYFDTKVSSLESSVEEKEKAMGNRMVEGINALADLCRTAFDHIKSNKLNIDKINAKLGDHSSRISRSEQAQHRMASTRKSENRKRPIEKNRAVGEDKSDKPIPQRVAGIAGGDAKGVQNPTTGPAENNGN